MLITVNSEIADLLSSVDPIPALRIAIARLLSSYADGQHVLVMDASLCRLIEGNADFSAEDRAAAKRIRNKYAEYGALPNLVENYIELVSEGIEPTLSGKVWRVPFVWFATNPLHDAQIVCEDLNDISVLREAAVDSLTERRLHAFRIRLSSAPGGGGNTHRVLEDVTKIRKQICICIVDSDRQSPHGTLGATAQPCVIYQGPGIFSVQVTEGRTIENSIPWKLFDKVRPALTPRPSEGLAKIEQKSKAATKYINLKRGICGYELPKHSPNCQIYWRAALEASATNSLCCESSCGAPDIPRCKLRLHPGFGNSLLSDVAHWLTNNKSKGRANEYLPSPNDSDWKRLGSAIASYGIGLAPRRI